jgi:sRNA-binding protein
MIRGVITRARPHIGFVTRPLVKFAAKLAAAALKKAVGVDVQGNFMGQMAASQGEKKLQKKVDAAALWAIDTAVQFLERKKRKRARPDADTAGDKPPEKRPKPTEAGPAESDEDMDTPKPPRRKRERSQPR